MAIRHVDRTERTTLNLGQTGTSQHTSIVYETVEHIRENDPIVGIDSDKVNVFLEKPVPEVLGPVLTWALAGGIVSLAGGIISLAGASLIFALRKVCLHCAPALGKLLTIDSKQP
jgi:hypothetical protein